MTSLELAQRDALARCKFSPGTTAKRFVRQMSELDAAATITTKQSAFLDKLAHSYRRQIGRCMAANCVECAGTKMKRSMFKLTSAIFAGRRVIEVRNRSAAPTWDEVIRCIEHVEGRLPATKCEVRWEYIGPDNLRGHWRCFHRCECGDIAFGDGGYRACVFLASCLVETDRSGPAQVRFERAERTLDRLAKVVDRLQHEVREVPR